MTNINKQICINEIDSTEKSVSLNTYVIKVSDIVSNLVNIIIWAQEKLNDTLKDFQEWYQWKKEKIAIKTKRDKTSLSSEVWTYIDLTLAKILWVSPENQTIISINNQLEELGLQAIHPVNGNKSKVPSYWSHKYV